MTKLHLQSLDADAYLRDPAIKQRYVTTLFDTIAGRYDWFTHWFSFGKDARWKWDIAERVAATTPRDGCVVDLACGTGDLAFAVVEAVGKGVRVVGVDPARRMLDVACERRGRLRADCAFVLGDMMAIPLPARSVDTVTVSYGFRNVPDHHAALVEVARVLKPGGWLFSLDFFLPPGPRWRRLFLSYLGVPGRTFGRLMHRAPQTYGYIATSLERWVTAAEFQAAMAAVGFDDGSVHSRFGGGICVHGARIAAPPRLA